MKNLQEFNAKYSDLKATNVSGKITIKRGRKILARIYDRNTLYEATGRVKNFSQKTPFSLEMSIGIRECISLQECLEMFEKYMPTKSVFSRN